MVTLFRQRMRTWKANMARTERVVMAPTRPPDASSRASGTSSEKTIQIMAPAANPSPQGNRGLNDSTKTKAGTAIKGCGKLENTLHRVARVQLTPRERARGLWPDLRGCYVRLLPA